MKKNFEDGELEKIQNALDIEHINRSKANLLKRKADLQKELRSNADAFLLAAQATALNFKQYNRLTKADTYFRESLDSDRNENNLPAYAKFLQIHNRNKEAIPIYQEVAKIYQQLIKENPEKHLPKLAIIYNNSGALYRKEKLLDKMKLYHIKALEIRIKLAKNNPQIYLSDVAKSLHNLANYYMDIKAPLKAANLFSQSLNLFVALAETIEDNTLIENTTILKEAEGFLASPNDNALSEEIVLPNLNMVLGLLSKLNLPKKDLEQKYNNAYLPHFALALDNLGTLYKEEKEFDKAESAYQEALKVATQLAKVNWQNYAPRKAIILNNLGDLYKINKELNQSDKCYTEALQMCRQLVEHNAETYLPYMITILAGLGKLKKFQKDKNKAKEYLEEALIEIKPLVEDSPKNYQSIKAEILKCLKEI